MRAAKIRLGLDQVPSARAGVASTPSKAWQRATSFRQPYGGRVQIRFDNRPGTADLAWGISCAAHHRTPPYDRNRVSVATNPSLHGMGPRHRRAAWLAIPPRSEESCAYSIAIRWPLAVKPSGVGIGDSVSQPDYPASGQGMCCVTRCMTPFSWARELRALGSCDTKLVWRGAVNDCVAPRRRAVSRAKLRTCRNCIAVSDDRVRENRRREAVVRMPRY